MLLTNSIALRFVFLIFTAVCFFSATVKGADDSYCLETSDTCAAVNQWKFSVALGAGAISNPLHGGKDIPLVLIPYVQYYGENIFLENNVLGYSVVQTQQWVISAISQLNKENIYFNDWQPEHLLVPSPSEGLSHSAMDQYVDKNDIQKRKWAIDAGIQINWFPSRQSEVKLMLLHDINKVYRGLNGSLAYFYSSNNVFTGGLKTRFGIGFDWQSQELTDYYYGLSPADNVDFEYLYKAKQGTNPFVSISASYPINQHWTANAFIKHYWLGSHMTNSPLVKDDAITSAFIGVVYAF